MYYFDTYALIEVLIGNEAYGKYKNANMFVSAITIGEFYGYLLRNYKEQADKILSSYSFAYLPITPEVSCAAAKFKLSKPKSKFSWIDAIGYELAVEHHLKFLTGDKEFKTLPNVEYVK